MFDRPTTSRMELSATAFTLPAGSCMLNRKFSALLISQNTEKSISTMFSSPVSIRLSSGISRPSPAVPTSSETWADRHPVHTA